MEQAQIEVEARLYSSENFLLLDMTLLRPNDRPLWMRLRNPGRTHWPG
jgi:hypothetical protein